MKYTKTAVAVAVAGLAAMPMMASAETTLSGVIEIKVQGNDSDGSAGNANIAAGDIRVAINTQQEIVGGLTGYGNVQFTLDDLTGEGGDLVQLEDPQEDDTGLGLSGSAGTVAADNVYVGFKGAFGDVRVGEIPLAVEYGQLANDIYDVGADVVDGISYTGAFGPASVVVNYSFPGVRDEVSDDDRLSDSDMVGIGAKASFFGVTLGAGYEQRNLSEFQDTTSTGNFAVGAAFAIAGASVAAHYWAQEGEDGEFNQDGDQQSLSAQVGYGIAGVNLQVTYSLLTLDISDEDEGENSTLRLDAGYDLGGGLAISTRISAINFDPDLDDSDDLVEYRVQLAKVF